MTRPAFSAVTGNFALLCGLPVVPFAALFAGHLALKGANLFPMIRPFWEYIPEYLCGAVLLSPAAGLFFALAACVLRQTAVRNKEKKDAGKSDYENRTGVRIFIFLIRLFGVTPAYVLAAIVVVFYVIFFPGIRRVSSPYLRHRFRGTMPLSAFSGQSGTFTISRFP